MRKFLHLQALSLALLGAAGCSSTLDEYRCATNAECSQTQSDGVCHSSGYCAFPDTECNGLRFGELSGERSEQCVDDQDPRDGGMGADADPSRPTAIIAPINLPCGKTTFTADGRDSTATPGATIIRYSWEMRSPDDGYVGTLEGTPDSEFVPTVVFESGTITNPGVSLAPYADETALLVVASGANVVSAQSGVTIPPGNHRLAYTIARNPDSGTTPTIETKIRDGDDVLASWDAETTDVMTRNSVTFNAPVGLTNATVSFSAPAGQYWIDNVRVTQIDGNSSLAPQPIKNGSFESGDEPWQHTLGIAGQARPEVLPNELGQYGLYELQLVVTDSNGLTSTPAVTTLSHERCTDGG